jgi:hypothetical protein
MNTRNPSTVLMTAAVALFCLSLPRLSAQTTGGTEGPPEKSPDENSADPVVLIISYGGGSEARFESHRGIVGVVSMHPDEMMPLSLQFTSDKVGLPVAIAPVDGGDVVGMESVSNLAVNGNGQFTFNYEPKDALSVDNDGLVHFGFQPVHHPGLYRLMVQLPGEQHVLNFYVIDPDHPAQSFRHP